MFELLKRGGLWRDIVLYFDRAVLFDPLEEALHLFYLEALLSLGEYKNALSHYNYITSRIDRELGVKPTSAFRNIYGQIIAGEKNAIQADIYGLRREFSREDKKSGALFCDPNTLKPSTIWRNEKVSGAKATPLWAFSPLPPAFLPSRPSCTTPPLKN
jgi:hypothetical protein